MYGAFQILKRIEFKPITTIKRKSTWFLHVINGLLLYSQLKIVKTAETAGCSLPAIRSFFSRDKAPDFEWAHTPQNGDYFPSSLAARHDSLCPSQFTCALCPFFSAWNMDAPILHPEIKATQGREISRKGPGSLPPPKSLTSPTPALRLYDQPLSCFTKSQ